MLWVTTTGMKKSSHGTWIMTNIFLNMKICSRRSGRNENWATYRWKWWLKRLPWLQRMGRRLDFLLVMSTLLLLFFFIYILRGWLREKEVGDFGRFIVWMQLSEEKRTMLVCLLLFSRWVLVFSIFFTSLFLSFWWSIRRNLSSC